MTNSELQNELDRTNRRLVEARKALEEINSLSPQNDNYAFTLGIAKGTAGVGLINSADYR